MKRRILRIVGIGAVLTALMLTLLVPIVASAEDEVTQQNIIDEYQNDGLTYSQATYQVKATLTELLPSEAFQGNVVLPQWLDTFLRHGGTGTTYSVGYSFIKIDMNYYNYDGELVSGNLGIVSLGDFFNSADGTTIALTRYNSYYDTNIGIIFEKALDWNTFEFKEFIRVSGGDLLDPSTTDFTFTVYENPLVKINSDYEVLVDNYYFVIEELQRSMDINQELRDTIAQKNLFNDIADAFYDGIANFLDAFDSINVLGVTLKDIIFILLVVVFIVVIVKVILVVL